MKTPSITYALIASALAAFTLAVVSMPPLARGAELLPSNAAVAQADGLNVYRRGDGYRHREERYDRRAQDRRGGYVDCHRDVQTHRLGGRMVTHRHVGDSCAVREVRRLGQPTGR